ncbi:Protein Ycf2 like [Actinidia chinensis var. chinensis]|uniref:Protein Ycf2 like n=1 Tax=Actinidia chinensis var. chinensis TaxID=1590841 RepID=A0A2R6PV15_ACTCC|nr:Protein Ycf2 like [Actinidia chinensis var. chinensis]
MEGSDKGFSSSTPSKPSPIPKFSTTDAGGTNENDQNYDKIGSKSQNLKKPPMKHFMSPTISAASKVQAPRKKILVERNEISNFSDTHLHNTPNLDSKPSSESGDDEQNNSVSDSSSKSYDPFTNYLSPRPKFLRYKPNRRREIFLSQENEILKEKDRSGVKADSSVGGSGHSSLIPTLQEGSDKQEDEEITVMTENDQDADADADEEIEEFEKENCLSLKGVLKFLLVLAILFSSTLYISSMNSSPTLQGIRGLKDGYCEIYNHTLEVATSKIFEGLIQRDWTQLAGENGFEEELMVEEIYKGLVESTNKLGEVEEMENEKIEDICDHELDEADEVSANGEGVYDEELEKNIGTREEESEEVNDHNPEKTIEGFDQLEGIETVETAEKFEKSEDEDTIEESEAISIEEVGQVVENKKERVEGHTENVDGEIVTTEGLDNGNTIEESEAISIEEVGQVVENKEERVEGLTENVDGEIVTTEGLDNGNTEAASGVTIKHPIDFNSGIVIGFSIFLALSVVGFCWRRKKTHVKQSLSTKKPITDSVLAEKISPVGPVHIEKVQSFVNPSSLICSKEETSKDFYQIRAPTVELMGEFEVGGVSSSIRSCTMISKIMETEMSYNSGFKEKGKQIEANVVSSQVRPSASDFSTMNSPSYGSFTAEKKIVKKEEGKNGEVKTVITTPVRRSSRIRNREVMSP